MKINATCLLTLLASALVASACIDPPTGTASQGDMGKMDMPAGVMVDMTGAADGMMCVTNSDCESDICRAGICAGQKSGQRACGDVYCGFDKACTSEEVCDKITCSAGDIPCVDRCCAPDKKCLERVNEPNACVDKTTPDCEGTCAPRQRCVIDGNNNNICVDRDARTEACIVVPPLYSESISPSVAWTWPDKNLTESKNHVAVTMTPVVGDVVSSDASEMPHVVFVAFEDDGNENTRLRVVQGATGEDLLNLSELLDTADEVLKPLNNAALALANLDADSELEILLLARNDDRTKTYLVALELTQGNEGLELTRPWEPVPLALGADISRETITVADLDGDGGSELIAGSLVMDRAGNILCDLGVFGPSTVAELGSSGAKEIIKGGQVFGFQPGASTKCPVLTSNTPLPGAAEGFIAVADLVGDPALPDLVTVSNGAVQIYEVTAISESTITLSLKSDAMAPSLGDPSAEGGGPVTIADIDHDFKPELMVMFNTHYVAYDINDINDLKLKWTKTIAPRNSPGASSAFDFDADGAAELLFMDQESISVALGRGDSSVTEGAKVLHTEAYNLRASLSYPVVADLDGDHSAEIIIPSLEGLIVWENTGWVDAQELWPQYDYRADDYTTRAAPFNSLRAATSSPDPLLAADLSGTFVAQNRLSCDDPLFFNIELKNKGLKPVLAGSTSLKVEYSFAGSSDTDFFPVIAVPVGATRTQTISLSSQPEAQLKEAGTVSISVTLNTAKETEKRGVRECSYIDNSVINPLDNNSTSFTLTCTL